MESLKEIFDALSQRIKSPIFGYIILAFIVINWKVIFCFLFSNEPVFVKFNYFDANTDPYHLYWYPLVFGLIAALTSPYISNWGAWWATKPINAMRIREVSAAHEVLQAKNQLAAERDNEKAIYEQSLIDQAKRDQEISEIEDEKIRQDLEEKVKSSRDETNRIPLDNTHISEWRSEVETPQEHIESVTMPKITQAEILADSALEEAQTFLMSLNSVPEGRISLVSVGKLPQYIQIGVDQFSIATDRRVGIKNLEALKFLQANNLIESAGANESRGTTQASFLVTKLGYEVIKVLLDRRKESD